MLSHFENKVADFIKTNDLFATDDRVLLAVSGGADSTALMYLMQKLKNRRIISAELLCAHINHQLRGPAADRDEEFVAVQADRLNLPVITTQLDVSGFAEKNKLSIETAARKLRIDALLHIAKANKCRCIITAHQKNDNAETLIHRMLRGTGFRGLGGIWPVRRFAGQYIFARPLLCVTRQEIVDYLNQKNVKWCIDHTNYDCEYRRNFIRHRLLPSLQTSSSTSLVEQLSELAGSARKFYDSVCSRADKVWDELVKRKADAIVLDLRCLSQQPGPVKVEIVRRSLVALGSGERNLTHRHYKMILQLAEQEVGGKKISLPAGLEARRQYSNLIFTPVDKNVRRIKKVEQPTKLKVPGRLKFGRYLIEADILQSEHQDFETFKAEKTSFIEWFDMDKLTVPLTVRFRRTGDRFQPLGLEALKKVGKFLTDQKVTQDLRNKTLIVADSEKIIWLWPIRIAENVKVSPETRTILQLRITNPGSE